MFIAKNEDLIIRVDNTKEALEEYLKALGAIYTSIEETDIEYVLYNNGQYLTEEEITQKERERLNLLSMTKREMFLGLYQAKGITPDMLKAQITDPQALIEFEYANDYYRGNPLIDVIGGQLGFTSEQLDKFFMDKNYEHLLPVEEEKKEENNITEEKNNTTEEAQKIIDTTENTVENEVEDETNINS